MALVAFVRGFTLAPLGRMGSRCPEPQDFCWRWPGCSSRLKQSEALLLLIFGGERVHVAPATKSFTAAHMHVTCPRPMGMRLRPSVHAGTGTCHFEPERG